MHLPERSHHEIYKRDADWKKNKEERNISQVSSREKTEDVICACC